MTNILKQTYYVAWSDLMFLKHNFWNILIMSLMSPILYLIAFGYGLRTGTAEMGVSYVAFVIPGIVALSSLNTSFSATSTRLNVQRLYYRSFDEMLMCPISLPAMVLGKSVLGMVRGLLACGLLYILGLFLAPELTVTPLFVVSVVINCATFSFLGVGAALLAKSHQSMATFNSLIILPMTFLCGTFFSVSSLPEVFQAILYCLPLTHASECIRAAALPDFYDFPWISLVILIAFMVAFYVLDWWLIKTRRI